jgi:hypothetical protein
MNWKLKWGSQLMGALLKEGVKLVCSFIGGDCELMEAQFLVYNPEGLLIPISLTL